MDSEVPLTNLLRCKHHWPVSHALTLALLTLTSLTLTPLIMRILMILFPQPDILCAERAVVHLPRTGGSRQWPGRLVPEVQESARVEAAFRLGDSESLHQLQQRCEDVSTRPAAWSARLDANLGRVRTAGTENGLA